MERTEEVDADTQALIGVIIRTLIYVVRWLARRYKLEHLIKADSWPH